MSLEEDPAAEFLSREQEQLGDMLGSDQFEVIPDDQPVSTEPSFDFVSDANSQQTIMSSAVDAGEVEQTEADSSSSVYSALKEAAEPESVRKWREEQAQQIAARDAEAEEKKKEWQADAKKELEDWHSRQDEVLSKNKAANREAQEEFLNDQKDSKPGQQWDKICKLCDFNPKNNRNSRDTSRMISIFLQLKQTPLVR